MQTIKATSSKLTVQRSAVQRPRVAPRRSVKVCAKYGENSRYFDLKDMENTTGNWDVYGQDSDKRYPGLQADFFTRAADPLTRREGLRAFLALSGIAAIVTFGIKGSRDAALPITRGPQTSGENGKGGSTRSKL